MSFNHILAAYDWDDIGMRIRSSSAAQVKKALSVSAPSLDDMMALLSPAAEPFLAVMARRAEEITRCRFGHTMQFFAPLYLSNLCANECTYCGFSMSNALKRKTLSETELLAEISVLKGMGLDSVLVVTGEHERKVGIDYFKRMLPLIKKHFSYLALEVQPLSTADYQTVKGLGVDAVLVYQETYHRREYAHYHRRGNKQDFDWRLATPERLGASGIDKIGVGALLGLSDWRVDSFFTALHLDYLQKHYWRSRYSLSFPRLRPCVGQPSHPGEISNRQLLQLICAHRLLNPGVEISLSTRESAALRDRIIPFGVTSMSAASSTEPGGYSNPAAALEQFSTDDKRSVPLVADAVRAKGLEPVWTDWCQAYSG
ncbi:2-iminoacetate synthase ThiH [Alteromonas gilva]|uniref:2-iminoacetate synthase ThiH n=1 Tax=Alteromonas gilva TaxID=2987522 RepID=A0ABT5L4P3_9ALTE|nr:2-iminoacetate synthase ThiH [Alteromonas gilva]MDC8832023.1 2-iminoacetate synthase ThiH [Alteromonas gilva]